MVLFGELNETPLLLDLALSLLMSPWLRCAGARAQVDDADDDGSDDDDDDDASIFSPSARFSEARVRACLATGVECLREANYVSIYFTLYRA